MSGRLLAAWQRFSVKAAAINLAVSLVSLIVSYLVLELLVFRVLFPNVDLDIRPHLPETAGVLAQNSKAAFVPRNYVALVGDSYAEGLGDWLLKEGWNEGRGFHAAHVIRGITGRDVVTFGLGGSSNAESFVSYMKRALGGGRCLIFPAIEDPSHIFAYFYEGNDLQDNIAFLNRYKLNGADSGAVDTFLAGDYGAMPLWRCHMYLADVVSRMTKFLYNYHVRGINPLIREPGGGNLFMTGGQVFDAPGKLEGPPFEMRDEDIRTAMMVFDRALSWLRARFPAVPITVVYIPSPLSTYAPATPTAQLHSARGSASAANVAASRRTICGLVREASARRGVGFLDAFPALHAASATQQIHGPVDWNHLNEQGYRAFGALLASRIQDHARVDACGE